MKWWASLRPPVRGSIVMVLVAVLVLGIVWSRTRPDDPSRQAEPGRIAGMQSGGGEDYSATFQIPGGLVEVSLDPIVDKLKGEGEEAATREYRPPPGGRLVGVSWHGERHDDGAESAPDGLKAEQLPAARLTLQSGSQRELLSGAVKLADPAENFKSAAFVFDSREPLVATLQFAGRRQSVDLLSGQRKAGAFASLYRPRSDHGTEPRHDVPARRRGGLEWVPSLTVRDQRTPYLAGLGWARKGQEWLVLVKDTGYHVSERDGDDASAQWSDRREPKPVGSVQADRGRLARKSPARAQLSPGGAEYQPAGAVFEVPSGEPARLRFTIRILLTPEGKDSPRALVATDAHTLSAIHDGEAGG